MHRDILLSGCCCFWLYPLESPVKPPLNVEDLKHIFSPFLNPPRRNPTHVVWKGVGVGVGGEEQNRKEESSQRASCHLSCTQNFEVAAGL